jgi:hypothetical protein
MYIEPNPNIYAPNPNRLNLNWRIKQSDYLSIMLSELVQHMGKKRVHTGKLSNALSCVLANVRQSALHRKQILYSRSTSKQHNYVVPIVDWLALTGRVKNVIGRANSYQGASSWFVPIDTYAYELERRKITIALANDASMIELHTVNPQNPSTWLTTVPERNTRMISDLSEPVRVYNKLWCNHVATLEGKALAPFSRRIFNHNYSLGGRYYGAEHLGLKKALRQQICIDGETTCEPDFESLHYAILYTWQGMELQDDPYQIDGIDRKVAKGLMLRLLNFGSTTDFVRCVTKSGNPANKIIYLNHKDALAQYHNGALLKLPRKPLVLEGFVEGVPDGVSGQQIYDAITHNHPLIAKYFGQPHLGLQLQLADSQIMSHIITWCASRDIPILPVHDSVRCKVTDRSNVIAAMVNAYHQVTGFYPKIKNN